MNPLSDPIFGPCIRRQRGSTEIIAYVPEVGTIVEIAFPVDSRSGERIVANGVKLYLGRRNLAWMCFCGLKTGKPLSTRIVDTLETGHTYVYCHYYPSRCGFNINLSETRQTAFNEDMYSNLPTARLGLVPDMQKLAFAFRNRTVLFGNGDEMIAPYFAGYCGSHASVYVGLRQLGGDLSRIPESVAPQRRASTAIITNRSNTETFMPHLRVPKRPRDDSESQATPARPYKLNFRFSSGSTLANDSPPATPTPIRHGHVLTSAVAGPSNIFSPNIPGPNAKKLLQCLADGNGISEFDHKWLLEKCDGCRKVFEAGSLRSHIAYLCRKDKA